MSKSQKSSKTKSARPARPMNFFQKLVYNHKLRVEQSRKRHAEKRAALPKHPVKRFFARLNPTYWVNRHSLWLIAKACFALVLLGIIGIAGLFIYYKNELKDIELSDITISETVNTYLDRNGVVLWEDVGDKDYRLVVDGSDISTYMRQAIVAIEDKNFYNHPGVDLTALVRAVFSTLTRRGVQGGSTLTQQLIKQVYFYDEAVSGNRGGLSRKIKELILALELEKMYSKEEIITMYLNESPYGGRRNGVESAAQTYFGKSAKELDLAESALLAAIPNNPAILDPYYTYGNEKLIERQHKTLDAMVELGYITAEEAEEAKGKDILATILPEASQYANMKAPHFVLEAKKQLEKKYGIATMRAGGYTIKTTLDYNAQKIAEQAVTDGYNQYSKLNGTDNAALVSIDVETSQVIAMVGSRDFSIPGYGEVNVTTSALEPGSSIKPILAYTPLFIEREGQNFAPGTILKDENIDKIYCAGYTGKCALRNASGKFNGNITIRQGLAGSLNIPAVKAVYINGIENSLKVARDLGDKNYCSEAGNQAGLSMAIGSGCTVIPVEHANAYASLARGGVYKDYSYILEVKNSSGDIIESWKDEEGTRVVDEQVAYMVSSILSDAKARTITFGSLSTSFGFVVPGVWTAIKTGTTTTANSNVSKDSWVATYSTAIATVVWNGNHDGSGMRGTTNYVSRRIAGTYMERVHKELYAAEGKWSSGDQPAKPAGIKTASYNGITDVYPSWFNEKTAGISKENLWFNMYNHKRATTCTKESYKIAIEATKTIDPMTKEPVYTVPEPYNAEEEDDCSFVYKAPVVSNFIQEISSDPATLSFSIATGNTPLASYSIALDGKVADTVKISAGGRFHYKLTVAGVKNVKLTVTDSYGNTVSYDLKNLAPYSLSTSSTH